MTRAAARTEATPTLAPLLAVNFVGTLGFSLVLPFLVYVVTRLGGNALIYGIMGATYSLFQLLAAPVLGRWSDAYGRRRVLLLSQAGTLASWILFLVALSLPVTTLADVDHPVLGVFTLTMPLVLLFVARALDGTTGGNVSVANAYLADVTSEADRSRNFGRMAAVANLGFVLGPVLAGLLGATALGERLPVMAAAVISLAALVIIGLGLPESQPCNPERHRARTGVSRVFGQELKECRPPQRHGTIARVFAQPGVAPVLTVYFTVYLAFNVFYVAFPVHAVVGLAWTVTETGAFFSVLAGMMMLVQGPVLSRLSRLTTSRVLIVSGGSLLAVAFIVFRSTTTAGAYAGAALLAVGNGIMWPSLQATLAARAAPGTQGAVQGVAGSLSAAASITGLLVGGGLYSLLGSEAFGAAAVVAAGSAALALRFDAPS